jgi:hypothetical protein
VVVTGLSIVVGTITGCASTAAEDEATEQRLAAELVAATRAAGVAPKLTPEIAVSLYGTDATAVCDAFDGGSSTAARNVMFGNLAQGRRTNITDRAVVYAALVVDTYCPDVAADFKASIADLDPVRVTR